MRASGGRSWRKRTLHRNGAIDWGVAEPLVEGVDFYREGPYTVFTEHYLLKRGTCCETGCRHCPYGFGPEGKRLRDLEKAAAK